jgi:hypothetical protein
MDEETRATLALIRQMEADDAAEAARARAAEEAASRAAIDALQVWSTQPIASHPECHHNTGGTAS